MRKQCKRIKRPASKMISPAQHGSLMVLPRMHLNLLLGGNVDRQYMATLAGAFNIAGSVGYFHRRNDIVDTMAGAQEIMARLIEEFRAPDIDEGQTLTAAMNIADRYIGVQQKHTLLKAATYVEAEIAAGRSVVPDLEVPVTT